MKTIAGVMSAKLLVCCLAATLVGFGTVEDARADPPYTSVESLEAFTTIDGHDAEIEVLVARQAAGSADTLELTLAALGAEEGGTSEWSRGYLWPQFVDRGRNDDTLVRSYNADGAAALNGLSALLNAQTTWSSVRESTARLAFGGATSRCPSLAVDCGTPAYEDGHNDVGWLSVPWDVPEGFVVLLYEITTHDPLTGAAVESDIVLNSDVAPLEWFEDDRHIDVETLLLHALGHALGLPISFDDEPTVMSYFIEETRRELTEADADLLRALYPKQPSTVSEHPSARDFSIVVERGEAAPGGGTYRGSFELGGVNAQKETAFVTDVPEGQALFVAAPNGTRQVVRSGQTVDGVVLGIGSSNAVGINDAGQVAFAWFVGPTQSRSALFRAHSGGRIEALVVPELTPAPGSGVFTQVANAELSTLGDVAFWGRTQTETGQPSGIYVAGPAGEIEAVARVNDAAPGGGTFTSFASTPSISSRGDVAFAAITTSGPGSGVYVRERGGELRAIVRPGDPAPGGSAFDTALSPSVNSRGDVLFAADIVRTRGRQLEPYLASAATITPLLRSGEVLPDGRRFRFLVPVLNGLSLNDHGDYAFVGVAFLSAYVFASSRGEIGVLVREFDAPLPGFGFIGSLWPGFLAIQIDDRGEVVLPAETTGGRVALLRAGQHVADN